MLTIMVLSSFLVGFCQPRPTNTMQTISECDYWLIGLLPLGPSGSLVRMYSDGRPPYEIATWYCSWWKLETSQPSWCLAHVCWKIVYLVISRSCYKHISNLSFTYSLLVKEVSWQTNGRDQTIFTNLNKWSVCDLAHALETKFLCGHNYPLLPHMVPYLGFRNAWY